jgi:ubiquinone/menaquinone biosynthesis C-methylase UbiE
MKAETHVLELLKRIGVKRGQKVLDFGCGSGTYAIPAAKIVGDGGSVYALDKNRFVLNELMDETQSSGLNNISRIDTGGEPRIELADMSIDVVLLFDVLHSYYFPRAEDRRALLDEIHRIAKPDALILVYPKHMDANAKDEIEMANFHFENEHLGTLVHDNRDLEQGKVLIFTKTPKA